MSKETVELIAASEEHAAQRVAASEAASEERAAQRVAASEAVSEARAVQRERVLRSEQRAGAFPALSQMALAIDSLIIQRVTAGRVLTHSPPGQSVWPCCAGRWRGCRETMASSCPLRARSRQPVPRMRCSSQSQPALTTGRLSQWSSARSVMVSESCISSQDGLLVCTRHD